VIFKISKTFIESSFRNKISIGKSTEMSKTLPILHFLAIKVKKINVFDFKRTGLSVTISSYQLKILAKGLQPFFLLTYIKIDKLNLLSNKYHYLG